MTKILVNPMIKEIFLIRHAKSSWANEGLDDYDRPLNDRGIASAKVMSAWLQLELGNQIEVFHSSALRTTQTYNELKKNDAFSVDARSFKELYHASANTIIAHALLAKQQTKQLLIIGHNPGISEAVNALSDSNVYHMPTLAIARIAFEVDDWKAIHRGTGMLKSLVTPKGLATRFT